MKTRMQPIDNVWGKFPRVVRDLALACGKEVRLEMEGKETELDRSLVESIKDPLTHLIRNAIDHGIESPELCVRNMASRLSADCCCGRFTRAGRSISKSPTMAAASMCERVKEKAIEQNLITRKQARLDERSEDRQPDLSSRFFDGQNRDRCLRSWRGHGRRQNEH